MVDSVNIPKDLTKIFEVKDTSDTLRRFLTDMFIRLDSLEKKVMTLETKVGAIDDRLN